MVCDNARVQDALAAARATLAARPTGLHVEHGTSYEVPSRRVQSLPLRVVPTSDIVARKLAKTINVGGDPRRIAFSQQGHIAAVTNAAGFITFVR
jgi:hypothetical protein